MVLRPWMTTRVDQGLSHQSETPFKQIDQWEYCGQVGPLSVYSYLCTACPIWGELVELQAAETQRLQLLHNAPLVCQRDRLDERLRVPGVKKWDNTDKRASSQYKRAGFQGTSRRDREQGAKGGIDNKNFSNFTNRPLSQLNFLASARDVSCAQDSRVDPVEMQKKKKLLVLL